MKEQVTKLEDDNLKLEKEALPQIHQALSDLSLTLPKLDDDLSPTEKIELSVSEIMKAKDALETLTRYVSSVLSSNGRTPLEDANVGRYQLDKIQIQQLNNLDIYSCQELNKQNMFDIIGNRSSLYSNDIEYINKFLVSRGYDSLAAKLENYDDKDFQNAKVKPEDTLPGAIDNIRTDLGRITMRPLQRVEINTYGRLVGCSKSELKLLNGISKYSIQAIEKHLNSLGLQLKQEDKD